MLTILSQARFWTLREDIVVKDTDFGAFRYYEKKDSTDSLYCESKKLYAEKRGMTWSVSNRRPNKLRDSIKELDEQLISQRVVFCQWRDDCLLQLMFSSGLIANICVDVSTGDILKVAFDKYLLGKLLSDYVVDVVFTKTHIVCSYNDNQLTLVYFTKPCARLGAPEKLSRLEPRLHTVELAGPSGRRLERRLSANTNGDTVLVWWRCGRDEVYPWSPVVRDQDRANVHVYSVSGIRAQLLCWYRTDHDPVWVSFSLLQPSLILSVEQKVSRKGEVTVESGRYEVRRARLQRSAVASVPLQTQVCCLSFSPSEDKLLLGCIDGSLVLFDEARGVTHLAKAAFISTLVSWHPGGALVLAANERCQFQCFDAALAAVRHQLAAGGEEPAPGTLLDLASYCGGRRQLVLRALSWAKPSRHAHSTASSFCPSDALLLLLLDRGPLAALRLAGGGSAGGLGIEALVAQYLSLELPERALALLLSLNWDVAGRACISCLQQIAEYLLQQPLTPCIAGLLQSALGSFHVPTRPMSPATEMQYADQVRDMTRRFFHHLLRYQQFEKAFRLAIDLQERDLFVDLYFYAQVLQADGMAIAAREKAQLLLRAGSESSGSSEGSCSCSDSGGSLSGDEDEAPLQEPPPLPTPKLLLQPESRPPGEKQKVKFSDTVTHIGLPESSCSNDTDASSHLLSNAPLRYIPALSTPVSRRSTQAQEEWARTRAEEIPLLGVPTALKGAREINSVFLADSGMLHNELLTKNLSQETSYYLSKSPASSSRSFSRACLLHSPNAFLPRTGVKQRVNSSQFPPIPHQRLSHSAARINSAICVPEQKQSPLQSYSTALFSEGAKETFPRTISKTIGVNATQYPANKENLPQALSRSFNYQQLMQGGSQPSECVEKEVHPKGPNVVDATLQHEPNNPSCRRLQELVGEDAQEEESISPGSIKVVHFGVV